MQPFTPKALLGANGVLQSALADREQACNESIITIAHLTRAVVLVGHVQAFIFLQNEIAVAHAAGGAATSENFLAAASSAAENLTTMTQLPTLPNSVPRMPLGANRDGQEASTGSPHKHRVGSPFDFALAPVDNLLGTPSLQAQRPRDQPTAEMSFARLRARRSLALSTPECLALAVTGGLGHAAAQARCWRWVGQRARCRALQA